MFRIWSAGTVLNAPSTGCPVPERGIPMWFQALRQSPLGLRGLPGYSLVQVDHHPSEPDRQDRTAAWQQRDPHRAQEIAESLLVGKRGAFVLLDAANGDILAAASNPAYDLSEFTPVLRREYYQSLLSNPDRPLISTGRFRGV